MKTRTLRLAASIALLSAAQAVAAEKTATLEVTGLYCASCPYIAAQAISAVASAEIIDGFYDPQAQLAHFVVRYDDALATTDDLVSATMEFGYPATLLEPAAGGDS